MTFCRHLECLFSPPEALPVPGQQPQLPLLLLMGQVLQFPTIIWPPAEQICGYESLPEAGDEKPFPLFSTTLPSDYTNNQEIENSSSVPSSLCGASFQATSLCSLKASRFLVHWDGKVCALQVHLARTAGMEGLNHCSKFLSPICLGKGEER